MANALIVPDEGGDFQSRYAMAINIRLPPFEQIIIGEVGSGTRWWPTCRPLSDFNGRALDFAEAGLPVSS